jgi:hypothetical protein
VNQKLPEFKVIDIDIDTALAQLQHDIDTERLQPIEVPIVTPPLDTFDFTGAINDLFAPLQKSFDDLAESLGRGLHDSFVDFLTGADIGFKDLLRRMAAEFAVSGIFTALSGSLAGSTGGVGKFFGKLFGGFKASGGPVSAGKGYVVGEKGPEFFTPSVSGTITPNGGAVVNQTNHYHFDVGLETFNDRLRAAVGPISSASMAAIMKALNRPHMA